MITLKPRFNRIHFTLHKMLLNNQENKKKKKQQNFLFQE